MENELIKAAERLKKEKLTCVIFKGDTVHTSNRRGVGFLLELLDSGENFTGFYAADKVVGRGAAFIYVLLGVKAVYAEVLSECARVVLEEHGIKIYYDQCPERIKNRTGTGFCPIEEAVQEIRDPKAAVQAIRNKISELNKVK